jgi:MoaA/NifB/PqqE/SkfB family radical SAM enzyme
MNYTIEADWHLLYTCNYRCQYCFFAPNVLGTKLRRYATPEQWEIAFETTGETWLLHITGGEPSIYPEFAELCARLTRRNFISLNSNLSHRSLEAFSSTVDPARVSFINAGMHPEERTSRGGQEIFIRNAELMRAAGFRIMVSLVATPRALSQFQEVAAFLKPLGLYPIPKLLRGALDGATYPAAYTENDKRLFRNFSNSARDFYQIEEWDEQPSIDMLHDDEFLDSGEPNFEGVMCDAGDRFVRIDPDGHVLRCGPVDMGGNILAGTFIRRGRAEPCNTRHCYYFCLKYSHQQTGDAAKEGINVEPRMISRL